MSQAVLDKWKLFQHPKINWQPNPAQDKVAKSTARHKVLAGGRRLGKDYYGGTDKLLPEVFFTKPLATTLLANGKKRIFWIVGPSYQESEKTFRIIWNWVKLLEIPMEKGSFNSPEIGLMQIKLWGGALEIIAKSAQVPDRLVGEGLSGVIMCEAAKMRAIIWPKFIQPTLGDFGGWSYFGSTPEGKNWFYTLWQHAQDPFNTEWESWRMPSWVNPWVYTNTGREISAGRMPGGLKDIPTHEYTIAEDVFKLLEIKRRTRSTAMRIYAENDFTIDSEILNRINDLPEELFLQEIGADFCTDTETEILTQRGWLRYNEVVAGDQTLGLKTDGTVEWTDISRVNVFPAKHRKMVQMEMRGHSSLTTQDHRWLVERIDMNSCEKRRKQGKPNWYVKNPVLDSQVIHSSELGYKGNVQVPCARPVTNLPETPKYTDALVELVAWYWTEGSIHGTGICIAQSKEANLRKWASIASAIIAYCDYYSWSGQQFYIRSEVAQEITRHAGNGKLKELEWDFILSLTRSQLELFIDKSIQGDGWVYEEGGRAITQKYRHNLDVLQMACQLAGYQTNLYQTSKDCWRLNIFERNSFRPQSARRAGKIVDVDHCGQVWCPSTGTSTWLARRNGTVYFTGNTEFIGRVFKAFDEETHVTDLSFNPGWETYAAIDYGFNNPNVWLLLQVGPWGEINVLDEIYESGLDPEDFVKEIKFRGLNPGNLHFIYPDPASPEITKILEKHLGVRGVGGTGGALNNRINWIRKVLREPRITVDDPYHDISLDGLSVGHYRPRLMFDRKCKKTIEDMLAYRYPDKDELKEPGSDRAEKPLKKNDHGPEALGRFFAGKFGQFGKTGTTIHQADFGNNSDNEKVLVSAGSWKQEKFQRLTATEKREVNFPRNIGALGNYLNGVYDE